VSIGASGRPIADKRGLIPASRVGDGPGIRGPATAVMIFAAANAATQPSRDPSTRGNCAQAYARRPRRRGAVHDDGLLAARCNPHPAKMRLCDGAGTG
jgi:hypothetical protein